MVDLILASGSAARREMLEAAAIDVAVDPARIDEGAMIAALRGEGARPRDVADALAEAKARKVSGRHPGALVLGADQILDLDGEIFVKAPDREAAAAQLGRLSGRRHDLLSAACAFEDGRAVWRHVARARMGMRPIGPDYLNAYLDRNWPAVAGAVGCYMIEGEGVRLFEAIDGDVWTIRGLPMLPLLSWLMARGTLPA